MSSLLNSLLPEYFKPKTNLNINSSRIQYGFNARIDMQYEDDSGTRKGSRPNAFMSNTVAFIGNYQGIIVDDIPILDGLRADIFDTYGDLDMGLVEDALSKSTMIRRNVPTYTAYASELLYKRNLTSLFYNMLRLYYIKKWGSIKYEKDAIFYDNGHACLLNRQLFPKSRDASLGTSLSLPEAEIAMLDPGLEFPEEDVPAILWHGRVSSKATCILGQACSEFAPLAPFSIAHYSPQLTRKLYVNAPAGIEPSSGRYTHEDVKDAITILVSANQAYTDFEAAYLMLAQTLVSPVPRTAEASAWFINAGMVNMPTLSCANGYYPALTNVNPYHRLDTWKDTLNHWVAYPDMLFYHSVAMIESCYVELGNVARVSDSDAINRYTFTELSVQGRPVMNRGIIVDLTLVAMRTGREISLPYPVSCGLTRTDALLQGTEIHVPIIVKDIDMPQYYNAIDKDVIEGQETVIKVKQLPPAMYPIYTYGINTTEFYSDHFEDQVQVEMAPIDNGKAVFNDARKFSKFMSIMRMMGNDVTATDLVTGRKVSNWADNSSGRFLYTDVKYEGQTAFLVDMDTIKARDHCWVSIIDPNGTMNLSYRMTNFRAAMFSRNKPLYMTGGSVRTIATGNYRDAAERLRAMDETLRLKPFKITEKLDFRVAAYAIPSLSGSSMPSSHHQEQLQISEADAEPINPIGEDELPPDIE